MVYYRERMRQFVGQDPPPTAHEMGQLRKAYSKRGSPPIVDREVCRLLIEDTGLSKKRLLEKWVTIRQALTDEPPPRPPKTIVDQMSNLYESVSRVWNDYPEVRKHPARKKPRDNIIALDMCLRQILLRIGQDAYDQYSPYFCGAENEADYVYWENMCRVLKWRPRVPATVSNAE